MENWHHPDRCPGSNCWGQFFLVKHYGIICIIKLLQIAQDRKCTSIESAAWELSREAHLEKSEGLGLA
jgi:hypothetical protein